MRIGCNSRYKLFTFKYYYIGNVWKLDKKLKRKNENYFSRYDLKFNTKIFGCLVYCQTTNQSRKFEQFKASDSNFVKDLRTYIETRI